MKRRMIIWVSIASVLLITVFVLFISSYKVAEPGSTVSKIYLPTEDQQPFPLHRDSAVALDPSSDTNTAKRSPESSASAVSFHGNAGALATDTSKLAGANNVGGDSGASADNTGAIDSSVVGREFEVAPAVVKECEVNQLLGRAECEAWRNHLAAMATEPRNIRWAEEMETEIRGVIEVNDPGLYSIRSLECRVRTCALELVMTNTTRIPRFDYEFRVSRQISTMELAVLESQVPGMAISVAEVIFYSK